MRCSRQSPGGCDAIGKTGKQTVVSALYLSTHPAATHEELQLPIAANSSVGTACACSLASWDNSLNSF